MYIDIGWFFLALLWAGFTALWGWMIYVFCGGATDVGLAGLIGMTVVSGFVCLCHFVISFGRGGADEREDCD